MNSNLPGRPIVVSVSLAFTLTLASGCAMHQQLHFDPKLTPNSTALSREFYRGEPLQKTDVLSLVSGKNFAQWQPQDFQVDEAKLTAATPGHSAALEFIVAADVQIHDRGYSFGRRFSRFADKNPIKSVETVERNFYQDHGDAAYLGFVLKAARQTLESNTNISFMIHLGDAMQLSKQTELAVFNEMVGKFLIASNASAWEESWIGNWLQTPIQLASRKADFFNVIGNHDVMFLGNFRKGGPIRIPADGIQSQATLENALAKTAPFSSRSQPVLGRGTQAMGYYFNDRAMSDGKLARIVVLNSNEKNILAPNWQLQTGTLYPSISGEQADWLSQTLRDADQDERIGAVIVFGHNQLAEITINRTGRRADRDATFGQFKEIIGSSSKVTAYVCGHLHSGSPVTEHRIGARTLPEFIIPSVQEFPKCFATAHLEKRRNSAGYEVKLNFLNIEDVVDFSNVARLDVADDQLQSQQSRLARWIKDLEARGENTVDRMKTLARGAYDGAAFDVAHDVRTDISLCFHPRFAKNLAAEYSEAAQVWNIMKTSQDWPGLRGKLNAAVTGATIASATATPFPNDKKFLNVAKSPNVR